MRLIRDQHEDLDGRLLNLSMMVIKSSNPQNNGKNGKIVNITKNMIFLRGNSFDQIIRIPKKEISKYSLSTNQGKLVLPGKRLLGRPDEIKSKIK